MHLSVYKQSDCLLNLNQYRIYKNSNNLTMTLFHQVRILKKQVSSFSYKHLKLARLKNKKNGQNLIL